MKYNLSEITELIKNRRTIYPKFYSSRKVHKEIIEHLIRNATWAPTHGKTQPWRFKVYREESRKELSVKLGDLYKELTPENLFKEEKLKKSIYQSFKSKYRKGGVSSPSPHYGLVHSVPSNNLPPLISKSRESLNVQFPMRGSHGRISLVDTWEESNGVQRAHHKASII